MTNEIKEILDDLRKTADNTIFVVCSSQEELDKMPKYTANFLSINDRKAKLLLDYITNLQDKLKWYENIDPNKTIDKFRLEHNMKVKNLHERIDKAVRKAQLIKDIGFDYDGYNDTENLKKIIDELVKYAGDIKDILRGDE